MSETERTAAVWEPINSLVPWDRNPRHNDAAVDTVAGLIERFGFSNPILARREDRMVIAGHTRLKAAVKLGLESVPVRWLDLSRADAEALAIADNRSAEIADWDEEQLAAVLTDLQEHDVDLDGLGFDADELTDLLDVEPSADAPEPEAPPENPESERGVVYELGPHRVMCGDSTSAEDVAELLGGETPNLMVTDPPYGVELDQGWRDRIEGCNQMGSAQADKIAGDDRADWEETWSLFPGDVAYVWHAGKHASAVEASLMPAGLHVRQQLIWVKQRIVLGRGAWQFQHEPCWYLVRKGKTAAWKGARDQSTVIEVASPKQIMSASTEEKHDHPTQKPLECMERPIRNHEGDVYDPFLGSGTALIAAARQGRRCYGMEISPNYVDVIRKRWTRWADDEGVDAGPGALR